jgi:hypothetical protein
MISPKSKLVVGGVVGIVPHLLDCLPAQGGHRTDQMPIILTLREKIDEVFHLGDLVARQRVELLENRLVGRVPHAARSIARSGHGCDTRAAIGFGVRARRLQSAWLLPKSRSCPNRLALFVAGIEPLGCGPKNPTKSGKTPVEFSVIRGQGAGNLMPAGSSAGTSGSPIPENERALLEAAGLLRFRLNERGSPANAEALRPINSVLEVVAGRANRVALLPPARIWQPPNESERRTYRAVLERCGWNKSKRPPNWDLAAQPSLTVSKPSAFGCPTGRGRSIPARRNSSEAIRKANRSKSAAAREIALSRDSPERYRPDAGLGFDISSRMTPTAGLRTSGDR